MIIKNNLLFCIFLILNSQVITSQGIHITPQPQKIIKGNAFLNINAETQIVFDDVSKVNAKGLQEYFKQNFGLSLNTTDFQNLKHNFIAFQIDENLTDEGYELTVADNKIIICAKNNIGWFYAIQTLKQLCSYNSH